MINRAYDDPRCPVCGQPCEMVYKGCYGTYVGCNECLVGIYAFDVPDCYPPREEDEA